MKKIKTYPEIGEVSYYPRKQKHIRLSLKNSQIRVSYPRLLPFKKAEAFLISRQAWIIKHKPSNLTYYHNLPVGRQHRLYLDQQQQAEIRNGIIYASSHNKPQLEKLIKQALNQEAKSYLSPIINKLSQQTKLQPAQVSYRYMQSQWGSCSHHGNIGLNSALVYLKPHLIEYVILHELCHLQHLNHSPAFWKLLEKHLPNVKSLREELRQFTINFIM